MQVWVLVSSKEHNYLSIFICLSFYLFMDHNYVHSHRALLQYSDCCGVAVGTGEDSNLTLISEASTSTDGLIKNLFELGWIWALICLVWTYFNAADTKDTFLLGIINVTGTGHREIPLKMWLHGEKTEFRLYKEPRQHASHVYLWLQCCVLEGIPAGVRSAQLCHSGERFSSKYPTAAPSTSFSFKAGRRLGGCWFPALPVETLQGLRSDLHLRPSGSPWSCCWLGSPAGPPCSGCPLCRRGHRSPAWCSPPECSRWWWECRPPRSSPRGADGEQSTWRDTEWNRKNWPNYFILHFSISLELSLMLQLEGSYMIRKVH